MNNDQLRLIQESDFDFEHEQVNDSGRGATGLKETKVSMGSNVSWTKNGNTIILRYAVAWNKNLFGIFRMYIIVSFRTSAS